MDEKELKKLEQVLDRRHIVTLKAIVTNVNNKKITKEEFERQYDNLHERVHEGNPNISPEITNQLHKFYCEIEKYFTL